MYSWRTDCMSSRLRERRRISREAGSAIRQKLQVGVVLLPALLVLAHCAAGGADDSGSRAAGASGYGACIGPGCGDGGHGGATAAAAAARPRSKKLESSFRSPVATGQIRVGDQPPERTRRADQRRDARGAHRRGGQRSDLPRSAHRSEAARTPRGPWCIEREEPRRDDPDRRCQGQGHHARACPCTRTQTAGREPGRRASPSPGPTRARCQTPIRPRDSRTSPSSTSPARRRSRHPPQRRLSADARVHLEGRDARVRGHGARAFP